MITWAILLRYSLQVLVLVAGAAAILRICRVRDAAMRVRVWQATLLLALALPWLQPSSKVTVSAPVQRVTAVMEAASQDVSLVLPSAQTIWLIGASAMFARLAVGLYGLRRLRRTAKPHQQNIGISNQVHSPVAFGWLDPVILLPPQALTIPEAQRLPMVEHEREHIRRQDWPQTVAEELCAALLWFHPAIWWVLRNLRTDREQAVDAAVANRVGQDRYTESLLLVATWHTARRNHSTLAATSMFRGCSLAERLQSIHQLKENVMTKHHKAAAFAALTVAAIGLIFLSASAAPLQGFPQSSSTTKPIKVKVEDLKIIKKVPPVYPAEAKQLGIQGKVVFETTLDDKGKVAKLHVISGHPLLVESAMKAVQQWEYRPVLLNGNPVSVETSIEVTYTLAP
ncbi:hypothetical protein F183_A27380 [Bryobacterales bacterium F-183]|nr:hypothetical protein F183_A27380 [Bryobacterales bacterium F-183]